MASWKSNAEKSRFGVALSNERNLLVLNQAEFSRKAKINATNVSLYERGIGFPKNDILKRIENLLGKRWNGNKFVSVNAVTAPSEERVQINGKIITLINGNDQRNPVLSKFRRKTVSPKNKSNDNTKARSERWNKKYDVTESENSSISINENRTLVNSGDLSKRNENFSTQSINRPTISSKECEVNQNVKKVVYSHVNTILVNDVTDEYFSGIITKEGEKAILLKTDDARYVLLFHHEFPKVRKTFHASNVNSAIKGFMTAGNEVIVCKDKTELLKWFNS